MIHVSEPDPAWADRAAEQIDAIIAACPGLFTAIEHIGSTSVPGLAAKPIIDLMGAVPDLDDVAPHDGALGRLGFAQHESHMPERLLFIHEAGGVHDGHLHIVLDSGWATRNQRLLRDHLRTHPDDLRRYAELKRSLTEKDGEAYTRAKTALIQEMVDRARAERGLPLVSV